MADPASIGGRRRRLRAAPAQPAAEANSGDPSEPVLLGIEGGGTRTVALAAQRSGALIRRFVGGPGNLRLLDDDELEARLSEIRRSMPAPAAVAIGLAGACTEADRERIRRAAARVWPGIPSLATNDLDTALAAAPRPRHPGRACQILVLSGTGSCCYGKPPRGPAIRVGGWGHLLSDNGSGYQIGLRALREVIRCLDETGRWPRLGARLLAALALNQPEDLIDWIQRADKADVAALAADVGAAAERGDAVARQILREAAGQLARDAIACAARAAKGSAPVRFVLAGGALLNLPPFARALVRAIRQDRPGSQFVRLDRQGAWGALELARRLLSPSGLARSRQTFSSAPDLVRIRPPQALPPTERRHPKSMHLDQLPLRQAIDLMLDEDRRIPAAIRKEKAGIEAAIVAIARAWRRGGRLFYVGAGTSGRLGVLDASECPPTFRAPPDRIQGIIAGGQRALWQSVEGAEDDAAAGARAILFRGVTRRDVVVGIAASGRTPFVRSALRQAFDRGALTVLLTFNTQVKLERDASVRLVIAPPTGPEILTGSTRLKAGTATKLILNMLTTLAMVRLGKVAGNLMVDLDPSNAKLRERAVRILQQLTGLDSESARRMMVRHGWVIRDAWRRWRRQAASPGARPNAALATVDVPARSRQRALG
ncbi:MAG TPA: N-acetylmuramic acid 6-phosphate etherase [Candidatus Paceibacterota bacterium]|nr:N-acetylmuramic acid 6-phosphate etherase [Verrucomicrobiota bacterium]HOX03841.1 N-acetylmuramic acid 6-phosphate etherase [Verrucomicrobiota bacterium]HRZ47216.1 N-acetylmuramic acid 6-phosphate etherase [Candidatus Paceibacterota bacterium]HRZ92200.1 N-acetylmuramic acid 6-phosphate etherase [Candidatus Paceibacterota bacterium]